MSRAFALAAVLALAVSGTGAGATAAPPTAPFVPPSGYPAMQVQPGPTAGQHSDIWTLTAADPSSDRIYLGADKQDCSVPQAVEVVETATSVTITVWGTATTDMCVAVGVSIYGYVTLAAELGSRPILHG